MNIKGQGHSRIFVQGNSDSTFSNFLSLATTLPISSKFRVAPPWDEEMKVSANALCHMTKMAIMPIYHKSL